MNQDTMNALKLDRRNLMKMTGAAAFGGVVLNVIPAAAQDNDDRPEIVVGVQGLPPRMDPQSVNSNVGNRIWWSMYDHLIRTDFRNGDPVGTGTELLPMIATGWERIDDVTLELTLRDDVVFHDGTTLTADDIKFSIERMMAEDAHENLANSRSFVSAFDRVEVVDDVTVRVITMEPDPLLDKRLGSRPFWIVPQAHLEEVGHEGFNEAPIGTGPYKFVSVQSDEMLVLEAHDDYFGGPPPIKRLSFQVIPEVATRTTTISTGETQVITNVPPDQIPAIEGGGTASVKQVPLANCHVLVYNTRHPLLADKRVRQALNLGINRQLLVDSLWTGDASVMNGHQVEEWGSLYNPERPPLEYNPDKAREILAETSYAGEEITFYVLPSYYTLGAEAAQAMVPMWEEVGLNVRLEMRDDVGSVPDEEMMIRQWSNGLFPFDPDGTFWASWGEDAAMPQRRFWTPENEDFNRLGHEARQTLDEDFRYDAYQTMLDIWEDEAPGTILYRPMETYAAASAYNWDPYSFWYLDFRADNFSVNE